MLNRSQFVTGSQRHRDPRFSPLAFTEHGALMAANILNSPRAVAMSVYVIRAFIKIREDLAANAAILKRLAEIDSALHDFYQKLRPLLEPPPRSPKPQNRLSRQRRFGALSNHKQIWREMNYFEGGIPPIPALHKSCSVLMTVA